MINTIQLQPHTTSTIPLHIESPETFSARTAIEIHVQPSAITDAIMATLTRNDETGQILIPTLTLTELAQKNFLLLETLEPHTFRDYVLTFKPIDNPPSTLQRQITPMEITYGIEVITPPLSQQNTQLQTPLPSPISSPIPSPTSTPIPSPTPTSHPFKNTLTSAASSPTPSINMHEPQVLGITTAEASTDSAIQLNAPPKPPPIFFILLFTGIALIIIVFARKSRFAPRAKKLSPSNKTESMTPPKS